MSRCSSSINSWLNLPLLIASGVCWTYLSNVCRQLGVAVQIVGDDVAVHLASADNEKQTNKKLMQIFACPKNQIALLFTILVIVARYF